MRARVGMIIMATASASVASASDDQEPADRVIPPTWSFGAFPTAYLHGDTVFGADLNVGVIAGLRHDGGGLPYLFTGEADTFGPTASFDLSTSGIGYGVGLGLHRDAYFFALPNYASFRLEFLRFSGMWNLHGSHTITRGNHTEGIRLIASDLDLYIPVSVSLAALRNTETGHRAIAMGLGIGF